MNLARAFTAAALVAAFLLGTSFQFTSAAQFIPSGQLHCKIKPGSPAAIASADQPDPQKRNNDFQGSTLPALSLVQSILYPSLCTTPSLLQLPFHLAQKATFFIRAP